MSGERSKEQQSPHSMLLVSAPPAFVWGGLILLRPILPADFQQAKNLDVHLIMTCETTVSSGNRVVESVTVQDDPDTPTYQKTLPLNWVADASRVIDGKLSLTPILNPDGDNWVKFTFPDDDDGAGYFAQINLFKLDLLITTRGVQ